MPQEQTIPEEFKNHIAPDKDWREIVAWVGDLPPLPHVASQALNLIEDPDVTHRVDALAEKGKSLYGII